MDAKRTEASQNQSDGQTSDVTMRPASEPADYDGMEKIGDMPGDVSGSFSKCVASPIPGSVEVTEQHDGRIPQMGSAIEHDSEVTVAVEEPANQRKSDHCDQKTDPNVDFQDLRPADNVANDTAEARQSQTSVQEHWRPSNPFLGVASSNNTETGDSVTSKSVSGNSFIPSDRLPLSTSLPSDMVTGYSKLRDSGPSSLCSASPYESPTHIASGSAAADPMTDAAGSRPDSLYLSRSILQERERQWLAKKGSYSSLSECDSSPTGSVEALIEAATSTPLHAQGTVSMEGDMITFVADGINELIKRSRGGKYSCVNICCLY